MRRRRRKKKRERKRRRKEEEREEEEEKEGGRGGVPELLFHRNYHKIPSTQKLKTLFKHQNEHV